MLSLRIALRYLKARKSHNAVNIISMVSMAGVAVATAAMVCVLSVFNGFSEVARARLSMLDADLAVFPAEGKVIGPADSLAGVLRTVDGVAAVEPVIREQGLAVWVLEQMQTHIGAYQDGQARVNQLFQSVPQEYRTVLQEELTPFIHQSVDELSRGLLPCFQRHCQAADLGKQMEEQAALLPEGEQEAFRSAVQQIMKRLHKSINMGKTQEQPAVQREAPSAEGLLSPQEDMTQPPQEREAGPAPCSPSVKVRLQQLRKDRRPAPAVTQVEMAPPEPGRPAKSEYDARRMQWEVQERAIPKPKARRPKPRKGPER